MSTVQEIFPYTPLRPRYSEGMLLDSEDFRAEQNYHRGQLARIARWGLGMGTVAGLRVVHHPEQRDGDDKLVAEEELIVEPGIAIDRLGRLIEMRRPWCIRLDRWFQGTARDEADWRVLPGTGRRDVIGDVFLRRLEQSQELRPGFAEPNADATDALVAGRTRDAFELKLVARPAKSDDTPPELPSKPFTPAPSTRAELLAQMFASYEAPPDEPRNPSGELETETAFEKRKLAPLPEHPPDFDPTSIFLARVLIRLTDSQAEGLKRHDSKEVALDNVPRRIVPPPALLYALTSLI